MMMMCASDADDDVIGGHVTFHLLEEQPAGTVVGNLAKSIRTLYRLEPEMSQNLQFQLIYDDNEEDDTYRFDVEAESGLLAARQSVDRERVCRLSSKLKSHRADECVIFLQLLVSPVDLVGDVELHVVIDDVNDHDPCFASAAVEVSFPETATSGTLTQLPTATDLDVGQNGRLTYELFEQSDVFDLVVLSGDVDDNAGVSDVFLRLKTSVDRETQSVFSLTLAAVDSGNPRRTGSLSISVVVSDANDHAPRFNATRFEFTTVENRPNGSVIGRVLATDADDGDNARVKYSVTRINGDDPDDDGPLNVDTDTGEVVVVGELDFERCTEYVLTVAAADCAAPAVRQYGYVHVVVHVLDENDNAPEVKTVGPAITEVTEKSEVGSTVLELTVSDADMDQAGQVEVCRVTDNENHNAAPPFSLRRRPSYADPARYSLVTDVLLDRESRDRYVLLIACVDASVLPLTGQIIVDVRVSDVNDNAPKFRHGATPIIVSLPEGNAVDDYVSTVEADDADSGENGSVSYSIRCFDDDNKENVISVLHVDNVTGVIRAAVTLDRERRADYDCLIVAADAGRPSLSSSTHLQLIVADVDDEQAVFESHFYEFEVAENLPAESVVGCVKAHDADQPPFNNVVYFLDRDADSSQLQV